MDITVLQYSYQSFSEVLCDYELRDVHSPVSLHNSFQSATKSRGTKFPRFLSSRICQFYPCIFIHFLPKHACFYCLRFDKKLLGATKETLKIFNDLYFANELFTKTAPTNIMFKIDFKSMDNESISFSCLSFHGIDFSDFS